MRQTFAGVREIKEHVCSRACCHSCGEGVMIHEHRCFVQVAKKPVELWRKREKINGAGVAGPRLACRHCAPTRVAPGTPTRRTKPRCTCCLILKESMQEGGATGAAATGTSMGTLVATGAVANGTDNGAFRPRRLAVDTRGARKVTVIGAGTGTVTGAAATRAQWPTALPPGLPALDI